MRRSASTEISIGTARQILRAVVQGCGVASRASHTRLCRQGKPGKVVMVAAVHTLLLVLKDVLRDPVLEQPGPATAPNEA